jgi:hypothetical protein
LEVRTDHLIYQYVDQCNHQLNQAFMMNPENIEIDQ